MGFIHVVFGAHGATECLFLSGNALSILIIEPLRFRRTGSFVSDPRFNDLEGKLCRIFSGLLFEN